MKLTGLHLLLTYQCTFECDHCFVWGSPWQSGTMTLKNIRHILAQARQAGTINSIYFEGGEPGLFYPTLLKGAQEAHAMGFEVGVVSNAYWATSIEDAFEWLSPFAGLLSDLTVSSDLFHYSEVISQQAQNAEEAARQLGIPVGMISIAHPEVGDADAGVGQIELGDSGVMYRGRAAEKLTPKAQHYPWEQFSECPHEDLRDPGRVHLDPLGYLHICQGITIGNIYNEPLSEICERFEPDTHTIIGPLLEGGPAELVRRFGLSHAEKYADACHLCYQARQTLRRRFSDILTPDQVYGVGL